MVSDWKQSAVVLVIKHKKDGETRKKRLYISKGEAMYFCQNKPF